MPSNVSKHIIDFNHNIIVISYYFNACSLVSFANIAPQYFFTQLGRLSPLCNLLLCNTILRTFLEESEVEHCKTSQFSCMQAHNSMMGCNSLPKGAVLCQAETEL